MEMSFDNHLFYNFQFTLREEGREMSDMKAIKLHLADPGHHMCLRCIFFSFSFF